ncbi:hypothetical protein ACIPMU_37390 [Streptomyces cyaneofuscatus]|uniref:hypothetical protein n=1 Tax=Streptomyces cyaneofuscatus TaxID=66883 RepID=UPI00382A4F5F
MTATAITVEGYTDTPPKPGTTPGTARFTLIHFPATPDRAAPEAPEALLECSTTHPGLTHFLLNQVQPGDLLHVTGTLTRPPDDTGLARLQVETLNVRDVAPPVLDPLAVERSGSYFYVLDARSHQVPVFTHAGKWIGQANTPDAVGHLTGTLTTRPRHD